MKKKSTARKNQKLNAKQKRMKKMVEYLQKYMNSYSKQRWYLLYEDGTLIDDVLYGLGVALDEKNHRFAPGYEKFLIQLQKHIALRLGNKA